MTIRARLRTNTFNNIRRNSDFNILTGRDHARLYTNNREYKGTNLPKGRSNFFLLHRPMMRLTSSKRIYASVRNFTNRRNILPVGGMMIAVPMTSLKEINSPFNRLYKRPLGIQSTRFPLMFNESLRVNTIRSLLLVQPLHGRHFGGNFVNSLERNTRTIRVTRVMSSGLYEWSLAF